MSWRDQLRKASFRGVEFLVDDRESEFGRRTVTHEYPLRDKPYVEDLGRKARQLTLEAFVLATAANGFNYMPGRDALIAAIEQEGPGVLQHPTLGELRVSVLDTKMVERSREGGMARFTLSFTEAGEVTFPNQAANTPSIVNARADAAEAAALDDFATTFKVASKPAFVAQAAQATLGDLTRQLGDLPRLVPVNAAALSEFVPGLAAISGGLGTLMRAPLQLGQALMSQIGSLRDLAANPAELLGLSVRDPFNELKMLRKLFDFGAPGTNYPVPSVPLTTPSRTQQAANQDAITDLVRRSAVITAARSTSDADFSVFQDAQSVRAELADKLDDLLLATDDDTAFNALANLRAAMVNDLTARGADLARLVSYTPASTQPALALAYDLYEDAERDAEIISRNRVDHPGFVRGGRALQVLADA